MGVGARGGAQQELSLCETGEVRTKSAIPKVIGNTRNRENFCIIAK